ncbi:hypothetical protein EQG49_04830 [Periweissella cryptocerci]|uniref:Uncharacterized protein n=1 Tax=Periweissella cryptocerci TaxID=2506420 RepID=A0A4P6YT67_9LACO|nr:hypothetical protein [Periweissella cryptocerci]QBO35837.1 hypothetical protein EQG49_04830 [Periweissella cryptocerci]
MDSLFIYLDDLFYYFVQKRQNKFFAMLSFLLYLLDVVLALTLVIFGCVLVYAMIINQKVNSWVVATVVILVAAGLILGWRIPKWSKMLFSAKE